MLLFLAALAGMARGQAAQPVQLPPGTVPFGVYDPDGAFANTSGVAIEALFMPWTDVSLTSLVVADRYAQNRRRALLVTLEPWTWSRNERNTAEYLRQGIADGSYDANIRAICGVLGRLRSPVTLRWAQEMDATRGPFIWSRWRPEDYISAYRRVYRICKAEAPDMRFMWSPQGSPGLAAYYPGDQYVDLVGISVFGYQAYDRIVYGHDRSFEEIFAPRYARAAAFGKPVVIAELGYTGDAAYVKAWTDAVRRMKPQYPNWVGSVYFNQREVHSWGHGLGLPDWRFGHNITR